MEAKWAKIISNLRVMVGSPEDRNTVQIDVHGGEYHIIVNGYLLRFSRATGELLPCRTWSVDEPLPTSEVVRPWPEHYK